MAPKGWAGHYHAYPPWTGTRDEYSKESLRVPGKSPDDGQMKVFLANRMPPVLTGQALLKVSQTSADRTWANVADAVKWAEKIHAAHPPANTQSFYDFIPLEERLKFIEAELSGGSDVVLSWYLRDGSYMSSSIVCCPNIPFFPDIPCPRPPRKAA